MDGAGDYAIYRLGSGQLTQMPGVGTQLSVTGGTVSAVNAAGATSAISLGNGIGLSLQNGNLYVITPQGQTLLALPNVHGLSSVGGQVTVQVGSLLQATLSAQVSSGSGTVTLGLTNVQINLGSLGGVVNGLVGDLKSTFAPLAPLFQPLGGQGLIKLAQQAGWSGPITLASILPDVSAFSPDPTVRADALALENLISEVQPVWNLINGLPPLPTGMYNLGGVSVTLPVGGAPTIQGLTGDLLNGLGATFLATDDPLGAAEAALAKMAAELTGANVVLPDAAALVQAVVTGQAGLGAFSYTLSLPPMPPFTRPEFTLAMVPVFGGVVTLQGTMDLSFNLTAGGTVSLSVASLLSGNPLTGLSASGSLTAGLQLNFNGEIWLLGDNQARLCGYKVTGGAGVQMTATLASSGVTLGPPTLTDNITYTWEGTNLQNLPGAFATIQGMVLLPALKGNQAVVQALEQTQFGGTVAWLSNG
ncbi:MAG TPA: hypothetical protein VG245_08890, partial [Candidatus Dormibacteraeota bacterium]|nr:hypothetical protein [Candidatus Dormibacteraeota bacterium]